jgi:hypothetical protein
LFAYCSNHRPGRPHVLANDVVLDLIGACGNRPTLRRQHPMRPFAAIDRARRLILEDAI